jgi:hypothetical protein
LPHPVIAEYLIRYLRRKPHLKRKRHGDYNSQRMLVSCCGVIIFTQAL